MSDGSEQRSITPNSPILSPLDTAPRLSPPKSRRRSPRRRPLHERSNSHSNQFSNPTIRIVEDAEDPGTDVYSKTPFPSQPSQILPPRKRPGYAFEGRGSRVSDSSYVANVVAKLEASQSLVPKPLQPKKAIRSSTSTSNSDTDTIVAASFSPSSSRFSTSSTAPSSVFPEERELEILQEEASAPRLSTIRAVPPSTSSSETSSPNGDHALTPRASAASLASTESIESLAYRPSDDEPDSSENVHVIQRSPSPSSIQHTPSPPPSSGTDKTKQASSGSTAAHPPIVKIPSESLEHSDSSNSSDRPRSASQPNPILNDAHHVAYSSGVRVSFPVVRAPSASSLWAESHTLPAVPSRMNTRQVHQWSSQLSTIPSESDRASRSIERQSQSIDRRSHSTDDYANDGRSNIPRRRKTISSISSSDGHASSGNNSSGNDSSGNSSAQATESTVPVPLPLFSPITRPSQEERTSDEVYDTISPLQSPPLRTKRSYIRRRDSDARSTRSTRSTNSRPGSAQSSISTFIASTIPAWARYVLPCSGHDIWILTATRVYYSHGERTSLGAPDSTSESTESFRVPTATSGRSQTPSETNFPLSIYRPRNRPHNRMSNADTISISEAPVDQDQQLYVVGPPRRPVSEVFTPRLRQDRRSQARLSAWKAPSFDDSLGTLFFSRQNRQILLFCLGFIFPFGEWLPVLWDQYFG